jgi:CubicO group peptidase (beta-lactamase class C family)
MKRLISVVVFFLTVAPAAWAQQNKNLIESRLEPLINKTISENDIPGFAIGIVKDGSLVYAKGFGTAKLGQSNPITPQSLFHMASVTKLFVATAVMQLVEQGKIDLDAPLVKYLTYFRLNDERYTKITIRQMLNHTSGIPDAANYNWDKPEYDDKALERYVRSIANLQMVGAPGEKFRYSNIAFEVLGDLIAKVSGESFESYVQKNILAPLGMKRSTLLLREADPQLLTTPHVPEHEKVIVSQVFPYNRAHAPSSTLYSNIEDMSRWAMANLSRGELDSKRILKASTYDLLWKPSADVGGGGKTRIGISWFLQDIPGHRIVMHSGGDTGFNSFLILAPDDSIAVVAMSNYSPRSDCHVCDIAGTAMKLMLGLDIAPPAAAQAQSVDTSVLGKITTEQVLEKYVEALGGKAALEKITSRMAKGTFEAAATAINGQVEIYNKAPNKRMIHFQVSGQGEAREGFNGTTGWEQDPDDGLTELSGAQLAQARRDADFYQPLRLHELYPKIEIKGKVKLRDHDAYLLEAPRNGRPKKWFFDVETGLLLRTEERDAKGKLEGAEDYDDYREVDGVKVPFAISLIADERLNVKLVEVKHNVNINDSMFDKPVAKPPNK